MGVSYKARRSKLTVTTFDRVSMNYKIPSRRARGESPEPYADTSDSRANIYLKLLEKTSGLDEREVFQGAPDFFKRKIGLKETMDKSKGKVPVECKAPPSLYRQRTCSGCSSSSSMTLGTKVNSVGGDCSRNNRTSIRHCHGNSGTKNHTCTAARILDPSTNSSDGDVNSMIKKPNWKSVWCKSSQNPHDTVNPPSSAKKTQASSRTMSTRFFQSSDAASQDLNQPTQKSEVMISSDSKFKRRNSYAKTGDSAAKQTHCVFAVNGDIVCFKGFGTENFINWFGKTEFRDVEKRCVIRELNLSGFTDAEIQMRLCTGKKLVIEGTTPGTENIREKKVKFTFRLPVDLEVDSLFMSRNNRGHLIIEKK